ncbi:TRAP transporter small permease subunit [Pseudomonas sp. SST3]|uniref:TRAP transporter small permease subunit n=1 Tax=Pseudomonas sp. SST3 TaxID=2267882 RepID=UPI0019D68FB9|nr:TRAP transporter small permease subunit [Pseudomonas sp. SST3]
MKRNYFDWPANALLWVAAAMAVLLVLAMMLEVFSRYVLNAPTLWAFDISYMLNGAMFILGCAYALKIDAHVRIDFLASRLKPAIQRWINGGFYLFLFAPILGALTWTAGKRTWHAFVTAEVEHVSPWAPLIWPFYSALAIGLAALTLQVVIEAYRYLTDQKQPSGGLPE